GLRERTDTREVAVSEAHYHVDVEGYEPRANSRWVCPSGLPVEHKYEDKNANVHVQSLLLGSKGASAIQVGVYHKVREMVHSGGDPVLQATWEANGWNGGDVFRVEARYSREFLRSRGVTTVDELRASRGGLWAYATQSWAREVVEVGTQAKGRWPTTPGWDHVARATFPDAVPAPLVELASKPKSVRLLRMAMG